MFEHSFPRADTRGILVPGEGRRAFSLARLAPSEDLADLIDWHWTVRWDLPEGTSFTQLVLPHPCVNVVAQADRLGVFGMARGVDSRTLAGRGQVVAAKFRPGGFRPLDDRRASALVGVTRPAEAVFTARSDGVARAMLEATASGGGEREAATLLEGLVRASLAAAPQAALHRHRLTVVRRAFDLMETRPVGVLTRVDDLAEALGLSVRGLQRLFAEYVGVSPKWVLMRHRVHLAAEQLAADPALDIAGVAHGLGYADQPHFTTDFVRAVGTTPAAYAARCAHASSLVASTL